jgi:glyoxylase-like metal-dependent hydrolase (beta-lactamase superfamily II)
MAAVSFDDVIQLHLADLTFPDTHPLRGQNGELFGVAIRHRHGLVLFDTGIGQGNQLLDDYYRVVHRPLGPELERHGHQLADVTAIVNSHLHFDHCGNNFLFPGVPIYVQSVERRAAQTPHYTIPDWIEFDGVEYREIDGDCTIASGVRVIPTPGHTVGHQSVVVDTSDGLVVLAGQAVYSRVEYAQIRATGTIPDGDLPPDPERYLASAQQLMDLNARRVYFSHDREIWDRPYVSESSKNA